MKTFTMIISRYKLIEFSRLLIPVLLIIGSCGSIVHKDRGQGQVSDKQLLDTLQFHTFQYFWDGAEPTSGAGREHYQIWGTYGFYDALSDQANWYPKQYLGIDQGSIVVMMGNYRSGLLWKLFMRDKDVRSGLKNWASKVRIW